MLIEYYRNIGTDGGVEEQRKQRSRVKELLTGLGMSLEELEEGEEAAVEGEVGGADAGRAEKQLPPAAEKAQGLEDEDGGGQAPPLPPSLPPSKPPKGSVDVDMEVDDDHERTNSTKTSVNGSR